MTTYSSTEVSNLVPTPGHGFSDNIKCAYASVATPSTFTTTDVAQMFYLPAGARVLYTILKCTDLDSGTTITLNVGDASSAARYISASTAAQTGVSGVSTAVGGIAYSNAAKTLVQIVPAAGPATTAGTIELIMFYTIEGAAS